MNVDYVVDCLFDLINESDLLNAKQLDRHADTLTFSLPGGSRFAVRAEKTGESEEMSRKNT